MISALRDTLFGAEPADHGNDTDVEIILHLGRVLAYIVDAADEHEDGEWKYKVQHRIAYSQEQNSTTEDYYDADEAHE